MEETDILVETPKGLDSLQPQPAFQPEPELDGAAVREAVVKAESQGIDPVELNINALAQGQTPSEAPKPQAETPVQVPEKFKKPNGEVDVEKLKASTQKLDEAIQTKEAGLEQATRTVEDYLRDFKAKENKFRNMPNPGRVAAQVPQPVPDSPQRMTDQQLRAMIERDFDADRVGTMAQLIEIAIEKRLQPIESERKDNYLRDNIAQLARKDPRILNERIYSAITAKLEADPDLWRLKNPHKAAWLEVKEDLRLGEPISVPAQPSRNPSPILGGGTPPPTPSSSEQTVTPQTLVAAMDQLAVKDPRDRKVIDPAQQAALDRAAKEYFDRVYRR